MRAPSKGEKKALERLEKQREEAARQLMGLRTAIRTEVGWFPQGTPWILPLAGLAAGVALALALKGRRR